MGSVASPPALSRRRQGLTGEAIKLCVGEVDLNEPVNQAPEEGPRGDGVPHPGPPSTVPPEGSPSTLKSMERDGPMPFAGLYTLALASRWACRVAARAACGAVGLRDGTADAEPTADGRTGNRRHDGSKACA